MEDEYIKPPCTPQEYIDYCAELRRKGERPDVDTMECPRCGAWIEKPDPNDGNSRFDDGTLLHQCMMCGYAFVVKSDGTTDLIPADIWIDDFHTFESSQNKMDRKLKNLIDESGTK